MTKNRLILILLTSVNKCVSKKNAWLLSQYAVVYIIYFPT